MAEYRLEEIAKIIGGQVIGDEKVIISKINSLDAAGPGEIGFYADPRYKESLKNTGASAVMVREETPLFNGPQIIVPHPGLAYTRTAKLFAPPAPRHDGISDQAFIHEKSRIGKNTSIYPLVYVGEGAEVGDESVLFPGVYVGDRVRIGKQTLIYPNVTILHDCVIGNNVIIHAGTVIGSDGFGFFQEGSKSIKIPQIGHVRIDDDVEIGANNCIDRAALDKTWIKKGVKTDNLVQIAHNVVIGENTLIVAQVGISGSVQIGREVILAGQVGIRDHVEIGDKAIIGPQSGVAKSISKGAVASGSPTMPHRLWLKTTRLIARLPELSGRLRHLEKKIEALEKKQHEENS